MTTNETLIQLRRIAAGSGPSRRPWWSVKKGYWQLADGRILPANLARSIAAKEAWQRKKDATD